MQVSKHLHDFQVKNVHYENEPFMVDDTVYHVKTEIKIAFLSQMRLSNIIITEN